MKVLRGQIWTRKEPVPDDHPDAAWNKIIVGGFVAPDEWAVRPVALFDTPHELQPGADPLTGRQTTGESVTAEVLQETYTLESDVSDRPAAQLGVDALGTWG